MASPWKMNWTKDLESAARHAIYPFLGYVALAGIRAYLGGNFSLDIITKAATLGGLTFAGRLLQRYLSNIPDWAPPSG